MYCAGIDQTLPLLSALVLCLILYARFLGARLWNTLVRAEMLHIHLLGGGTLFLTLLWTLQFSTDFGLGLRFLGVTVVTLMLGADLAITAGLAAATIHALLHEWSIAEFCLFALITVFLSVLISHSLVLIEQRTRSGNFFLYIMLCGFAGAMVTILVSVTAGLMLCYGLQAEPWSRDHQLVLQYLPLIALPEGILNGMLITGFLVFKPHWVRSLQENRYDKR